VAFSCIKFPTVKSPVPARWISNYHFWLRSSEGNPEVMNSFDWGKGLSSRDKKRRVRRSKCMPILFVTPDRSTVGWMIFNKRTYRQEEYFPWVVGAYQIIRFRIRTYELASIPNGSKRIESTLDARGDFCRTTDEQQGVVRYEWRTGKPALPKLQLSLNTVQNNLRPIEFSKVLLDVITHRARSRFAIETGDTLLRGIRVRPVGGVWHLDLDRSTEGLVLSTHLPCRHGRRRQRPFSLP